MGRRLEHITGLVSPEQSQAIKAAGAGNVSAGLRQLVGAGITAMQSGGALLAPIDELQRLADTFATVTGRRTPSGAWWAPSDQAMPAADLLNPAGDVVASPGRVVLAGINGAVQVDLNRRIIEAQAGEASGSQPLDIQGLAPIAALLLPAALGLAAGGPGRRVLAPDLGLALERLPSGHARLSLQGIGCDTDPQALLIFAAELIGLLATGLRHSVAVREQLEAQLQEVGNG